MAAEKSIGTQHADGGQKFSVTQNFWPMFSSGTHTISEGKQ
jgi:hypothetical protein